PVFDILEREHVSEHVDPMPVRIRADPGNHQDLQELIEHDQHNGQHQPRQEAGDCRPRLRRLVPLAGKHPAIPFTEFPTLTVLDGIVARWHFPAGPDASGSQVYTHSKHGAPARPASNRPPEQGRFSSCPAHPRASSAPREEPGDTFSLPSPSSMSSSLAASNSKCSGSAAETASSETLPGP